MFKRICLAIAKRICPVAEPRIIADHELGAIRELIRDCCYTAAIARIDANRPSNADITEATNRC